MTRDHDVKRAIRERMKATGERYTVARSALVAPDPPPAAISETSPSQGGTMAALHSDLLGELDERGFAVLRTLFTQDEVARMSAVVDEVISTTLAAKQEEAQQLQAAGERRINIWHPGEPGVIFEAVTDRPDVRWLITDDRLIDILGKVKEQGSTLSRVGAIASLAGFGHQGLHPDHDGLARTIGAWDRMVFVVMLSPQGAETGTFRALPGSHRTPPQLGDWGSAMPPHDDEIRVDSNPGDVLVYSGHLWKSATFNGGREPIKSLLVAGHDDVGWG